MKKILFLTVLLLSFTIMLTSCRPPELEGAFVDFNAKRYDNALKLAIEATDKYPTNPEAPFLLGKIYAEKEMFGEMVDAFNKSLERGSEFESQIKEFKQYYFQNEYKKAYDNYVSYQDMSGDTTEKAMKLLDLSIKHSKNASLIVPDDYRPIKLTGLAYNYKDENDLAIDYFKKLTELKPDTTDSWYQVGRVYFNNHQYEKAAEYNKKAVEIDPSFIPAVELLAFSYESLKDTVNSIKTYKMASEVDPNNVSYIFNLGLIYNKQASSASDNAEKIRLYGLAEEQFSKAITLNPEDLDSYQRQLYDGNLEIMYTLDCIAQIQQKKFEDCKNTALSGLDLFPDSSELYEFLAICYANLGETAKAKEAQERAKQLKGE